MVVRHIHSKGHKSGGHIDFIESTGHTVLSTDGRQLKAHLGIKCPQ